MNERNISKDPISGAVVRRNASTFAEYSERLNRIHSVIFDERRAHWLDRRHRIFRWRLFRQKQKRDTDFIRELRETYGKGRIVLAAGAWFLTIGTLRPTSIDPRTPKRPGPPCKKFLRRFATEHNILVVSVSENYTSQTCYSCGSMMTNDTLACRRRRLDGHENCQLIRGLRACSGCDKRDSRDGNAAFNIGINFLRYVTGMKGIGEPR